MTVLIGAETDRNAREGHRTEDEAATDDGLAFRRRTINHLHDRDTEIAPPEAEKIRAD